MAASVNQTQNFLKGIVKENPIVEHENYIHTEQDLENIKNIYIDEIFIIFRFE